MVEYFWKEGGLLEERTFSSHERVMYIKQVHGKFIETDGVKRENELDVLGIYCKKKDCKGFPLSNLRKCHFFSNGVIIKSFPNMKT